MRAVRAMARSRLSVSTLSCNHRPVAHWHRTDEAFGRLDGGAIHEVEVVLSRAAVSPQDVRLAIAIEVRNADHLPGEISHRAEITLARPDRQPIHRIDVVLSRDRISPQDV